jgi:hypothetical protein
MPVEKAQPNFLQEYDKQATCKIILCKYLVLKFHMLTLQMSFQSPNAEAGLGFKI